MKAQTIFADNDQDQKEKPVKKFGTGGADVTISKDEYREIVREAYKEGMKDAISEKQQFQQQEPQTQDEESSEQVDQRLDPKQRKDLKKSVDEGKIEAHKTEAKKEEQTKHKAHTIAARSEVEFLRAKGVFPFDPFPDTIIIDTTKVTIVRKQMFATEGIVTIPLKDVADAHVQTALFLASVTIAYMPHSSSPGMLKPEEETISCLKREDAIRIKNILKGVLIASAEEIDLAKLTPEEVVNTVEKFGDSEGVS